jgi:uncharacterized membrane protein YfcA
MFEAVGYAAAVLMGLSLGLVGGGGSILTVPILVYLFGVDPIAATAWSLFIVGLTALVGGGLALRAGDVDLKTGFVFAVPSFIGVYLTRAYVIPNLPDPVFHVWGSPLPKALLIMLVFSALMIVASASMIRGQRSQSVPKAKLSRGQKMLLIASEGLVVGGITGFVGAGGGFLIIPALVVLVGLPMKIAVGTSLLIIAAKSLIGFAGDLQRGVIIDWGLVTSICAISVVGLFVGRTIAGKFSDAGLKKGFGWFVLVVGSAILAHQVSAL